MVNQIDHIVEHLFHKKKLDDVSVYELERFIATYPYFAAGHFLLAKKTQIDLHEHSNEKVATTGLYYSNALWLQWLMDQDLSSDRKKHEIEDAVSKNNHEDASEVPTIGPGIPVNQQQDAFIEQGEESKTNEFGHDEETVHVNAAPASENITDHSPSEQDGKTITVNEPDAFNHNNPYKPATDFEAEKEKEFKLPEQIIHAADEGVVIEDNNINNSDTPIPLQHTEPVNDSSVPSVTDESEIEENVSSSAHMDELAEIENETSATEKDNSEEAESQASAASIERTLTTAALIPTRAEIEKNEFTFEPYHTIDYFASQGIRLQQSDLSKDKFGKQLKSFTEWLRSMKRLPQAAVELNMDEATQQSIQQIAEHSFEEKEIVTETMAEVWIKQGNKEKAIDTLHKLSLHNPSKSHYFAAKIEQLKAL